MDVFLFYDGYTRTVDQVRTRAGGSEAVPRTPTPVDPRSVVAQSGDGGVSGFDRRFQIGTRHQQLRQ